MFVSWDIVMSVHLLGSVPLQKRYHSFHYLFDSGFCSYNYCFHTFTLLVRKSVYYLNTKFYFLPLILQI